MCIGFLDSLSTRGGSSCRGQERGAEKRSEAHQESEMCVSQPFVFSFELLGGAPFYDEEGC